MEPLKEPCYLVIIGLSGGGKGTQAKLLEQNWGLVHISAGELLRKEAKKKTERGKKIALFINQGKWVPSQLTFAVLKPPLVKALGKGFVLDGFPRLPDQPEMLDDFLARHGVSLTRVIHLRVRPETVIARRRRAQQEGREFYPGQERNDESEEAIRNRFRSYQKTIGPILAYYRQRGILEEVDGERSIEEIYQDIVSRLSKWLKK